MRRILPAAVLLAAGLAVGTSCGTGYTESFELVRTGTVAVGQNTTFVVNSPFELTVLGQPRSTDLVYKLTATLTASTATRARTLAEAVTLSTEQVDGGGLQLLFEGAEPNEGQIAGLLEIRIPEDMDVQLIARGGPVLVQNIEGSINVNAATGALVEGATGSVRVGVERGNAIVRSQALPGSVIEVATNAGDAQVSLPSRPSVALQAQAGGGGQIFIQHPGLPQYAGGDLPYGAVVNGGLSQVVLTTRVGNIVIDANL